MRLRRRLGQVFLTDRKYIDKIVAGLDIEGKRVLEIGSGSGRLTAQVAPRAKKLYCLELDQRLCSFLEGKFAGVANIEIINADILKFPLARLGKALVVVGNIPYQISRPLIEHLISSRSHISQAYLTCQKEFIKKLCASPGSSHYSYLSCYLQYYAQIKKVFDIPARAFSPQPQVNSAHAAITFYRRLPLKAKDEAFLFRLINQAFSQRRKKIINALDWLPQPEKIFVRLKLDPGLRAENLSLGDYVRLANSVGPR